nr:uncharacterized protein LOC102098211 isoform X3 [Columba livia]XP_021138614.1 uncharacterized protein LOC102098211 isoform X3 [Columba livia]XP_021138618.1 uncharacterized protein LOC102098211 isoform X3 [Columba livia]XP_021138621.1 uncharacterized protein LOC102098211 isoform X3 [Columba livia]XP_021138623.1 uncharacterized protein LOC102098211 isoform X3 [Columba livia]XP_021138630.1 uncharacterized protein LOC102098211 isoform X3 [Columba livia]XP_021138637.1 uncharacterized protein LO
MGSGRWWEGCGRHRRIAVAIGRSYTGWKHLCSPFAVTRSPVKQSPLEKKKPPSQTSQNPRLSSLHRNQKDEILFPSLGSSREQVSQNRSRSPGKRWSGAVNPSNRRRENCTFLHVLQVLVPSEKQSKPPQNQPAYISWQDRGLRHHKLFLFGIKILRCCRKFGLEQILSHRTSDVICSRRGIPNPVRWDGTGSKGKWHFEE